MVRHIKTMEQKHKEERSMFNEYVDKIQRYFPYVEKLLPLIDFCRNTFNLSERAIQELCKLEKVRLKGGFIHLSLTESFVTKVLLSHLKRTRIGKDTTIYA